MEQNHGDARVPRVAVIVPVWNVEAYLPACIDSIRAQSWPNWECILVDDGSTDASGAICDQIAALDSRFTVVHKPNGGLSSARNAAFSRVSEACRYISFLDSDDVLAPCALETAVRLAGRFPDDLVGWGFCRDESQLLSSMPEDVGEPAVYGPDTLADYYFTWLLSPVTIKLFDAEYFLRDGLRFDENCRYSEDMVFMMMFFRRFFRLHPQGRMRQWPLPLYYYRPNPGSICNTVGARYARRQLLLIPRVLDAFEQDFPTPPHQRKALYDRFVQALVCGLDALTRPDPDMTAAQRRAERRAVLRDPAAARLWQYYARERVFSPYYLALRFRMGRTAAWLYRLQQAGSPLFGKLDWAQYYLLGGRYRRDVKKGSD